MECEPKIVVLYIQGNMVYYYANYRDLTNSISNDGDYSYHC